MKRKVFLVFFSFFVLFFLCTGKVEASTHIIGGVNISKSCGFYEVKVKDFSNASCYIEDGNLVFPVTNRPWYDTNPRIKVSLSKFGLNSQALYHGAYETIVIIFQVTLKEIDDGYQEFYIVDDVDYKNYLVEPLTTFEHGSGYQDGEYRRYEFYAEIPGKRFTTPYFTLGFSAHGFGDNEWRFGNVKIQVCLSNEKIKKKNLLNVINPELDSLWSQNNSIIHEW